MFAFPAVTEHQHTFQKDDFTPDSMFLFHLNEVLRYALNASVKYLFVDVDVWNNMRRKDNIHVRQGGAQHASRVLA